MSGAAWIAWLVVLVAFFGCAEANSVLVGVQEVGQSIMATTCSDRRCAIAGVASTYELMWSRRDSASLSYSWPVSSPSDAWEQPTFAAQLPGRVVQYLTGPHRRFEWFAVYGKALAPGSVVLPVLTVARQMGVCVFGGVDEPGVYKCAEAQTYDDTLARGVGTWVGRDTSGPDYAWPPSTASVTACRFDPLEWAVASTTDRLLRTTPDAWAGPWTVSELITCSSYAPVAMAYDLAGGLHIAMRTPPGTLPYLNICSRSATTGMWDTIQPCRSVPSVVGDRVSMFIRSRPVVVTGGEFHVCGGSLPPPDCGGSPTVPETGVCDCQSGWFGYKCAQRCTAFTDSWIHRGCSTSRGLSPISMRLGRPGPSRRHSASYAACGPRHESVYMFGGQDPETGQLLNDVWHWNRSSTAWRRVVAAAEWAPRAFPLVYCHGGVFGLLGGTDGSGANPRRDAWVSFNDGVTWTIAATHTPFSVSSLNAYFNLSHAGAGIVCKPPRGFWAEQYPVYVDDLGRSPHGASRVIQRLFYYPEKSAWPLAILVDRRCSSAEEGAEGVITDPEDVYDTQTSLFARDIGLTGDSRRCVAVRHARSKSYIVATKQLWVGDPDKGWRLERSPVTRPGGWAYMDAACLDTRKGCSDTVGVGGYVMVLSWDAAGNTKVCEY